MKVALSQAEDAPSGAAPPDDAPFPFPAPRKPRKAPSRPVVWVPAGVASPDIVLARYTNTLGEAPPEVGALRALLHGVLAEQAEEIARALDEAAGLHDREPLHRSEVAGLRHAAALVRAAYGMRSAR